MSAKKTFSNWLTTRYLLIVRNEENFAEKHTYSFNYARLILLGVGFFLVSVVLAILLVRTILEQWLDPRYTQGETKRQLIEMRLGMDSLKNHLTNQDIYISNLQMILAGEYAANELDSLNEVDVPAAVLTEQLQPIDSQFRAEFENTVLSEVSLVPSSGSGTDELRYLYLFSPLDGVVSDHYDPKKDHFGVDMVSKENEPVRAVADGIIIFASWTLDGGHVIGIQHRAGLVSVYKHNSELLKEVGNFVSGGEIIAIVGNSGELTSGPHLHFELWHDGSPVNPEEYIGL